MNETDIYEDKMVWHRNNTSGRSRTGGAPLWINTPFILKKCLMSVNKALLFRDKNTVETKAWLDKHYSDFAPGKSTVEKWFAKFKRGEMSTENDARSEHPKEAVTDENITKVYKIIFDNRKVKLIEIAKTLKISNECVGNIVNEYLDMRKLCSKWAPRKLTIDQKQQQIYDSKQCLELFNRNESEFLRRYRTMNETCLHHFTPESN
ncbi:putative DD34D transposase [Trichonephila clavipes]|nr:putative DD34D transposase [Trichonephila clavipes]